MSTVTPFLEATNINWQHILHDCSLTVNKGDMIVLVGENGCGKSSFLRCLSGWYPLKSGTILLSGTSIRNLSPLDKSSTIALLPQQLNILDNIPIVEWLCNARFRFEEPTQKSTKKVHDLLSEYHLDHLQHRTWPQLSGGEAQRLSLLALRLQEATCWMLDEPANHLDPKVQQLVYRDIVQAWLQGTTMITVTHNLNLLFQIVDKQYWDRVRIVGMKDGRITMTQNLSSNNLANDMGQLYDLQGHFVDIQGSKQLYFSMENT